MSVGLSGEDTATLGIDALRGIQVAQEEQPDLQFGETVFPLQLDTQDTACGTEGAATAEYFTADARVAGAAANRNVYLASNLPHQETEEQRARQAAFAARYEERFGEAPVSHVHDNAYDTYLMLRAAIEQVGTLDDEGNLRIDRAALAAALRSYGPVAGLSGPLACDGSGECASTPIGSGRYRMASSRSSRRWLTPAWRSNECNSNPLRYTEHKRPIQTAGHLPRQGGNHEMDA